MVLAWISLGLLFFKQAIDAMTRRAESLRLPLAQRVVRSFSGDGMAMQALPLTGAVALVIVGILLTLRALGQPGMSL